MISVIIPMYNVEKYLPDSLFSILNQSYQEFEVICVDDCSTDSTLEILEYFEQLDSRIRVIKNSTNRGPGYSRNRGIDVAHGKYLFFLDSDDWLSFDALKLLVEKAENDELDVLMFKNYVFYEDSQKFGTESYYEMDFMNKWDSKIFNHWDLDKTKFFAIPNPPWNKLYLKSFLDDNQIRFPNENLIQEDNPFFYKVITDAKRVSLINKHIYNRRRRSGSIMTLKNERLLDNIPISHKIISVFLEHYELYEYYKREVLYYIFVATLMGKYNQIEATYKKQFFIKIQKVFSDFIEKYGLYEDIKKYVDKEVLDFFKFEEIAKKTITSPLISVVIPVYNVENYLIECLDSICNQTLKNIEIICINDGSTDNSLRILNEYKKKDSRISIITQNNGGLSSARNTGLKYVSGKYIYFIDSDDYLDLNALKELYEISEEKNLDMLLFKIICFDEDTKEKFTTPYFEMEFLSKDIQDNVFNYRDIGHKFYNLDVTMQSKFFKAELISNFEFPNGLIFEDNPFFTEAMFNAKRVYFYNKHLCFKRERKNSITGSGKNFSDIIKIRNRIIDLAKKYGNFDGFEEQLYSKKFNLIKFRFSQTSEEHKEVFFNEIKKDFLDKKEEYLNSPYFNNLPIETKNIFFAGLNSDSYHEFERKINSN